jgi:hypothetical protein
MKERQPPRSHRGFEAQVIEDRWCGPRGRVMDGRSGFRPGSCNKPAQMAVPLKENIVPVQKVAETK